MTPMQQDQQNQPPPPAPVAVAAAAAGNPSAMNPRMSGALMLGGGMVLEGMNVFFLVDSNTYYPKLLILGAVLMPLGLWSLVTGIAYDKNAVVKPPTWWTVGAVLITIAGLIAGIGATVALSE